MRADRGSSAPEKIGDIVPADIICEFCEAELTLQTVVSNCYGSCCSKCNRKVEDFVCTETGTSGVMEQIARILTEYGDACFHCGGHEGDGYKAFDDRRKQARKKLMKFVSESLK
jgi:hypothetical protein